MNKLKNLGIVFVGGKLIEMFTGIPVSEIIEGVAEAAGVDGVAEGMFQPGEDGKSAYDYWKEDGGPYKY